MYSLAIICRPHSVADILVGAVIGYRPCSVAYVTHRFVLCDAIFFTFFIVVLNVLIRFMPCQTPKTDLW